VQGSVVVVVAGGGGESTAEVGTGVRSSASGSIGLQSALRGVPGDGSCSC
jgi:hypothetical protein